MALMLLDHINAARANPLEAAFALGKNPDQMRSAFPDQADFLMQGIAPLVEQPQLVLSATRHTNDMFTRDYYGKISPDGVGPIERILAVGYAASNMGESLGVIAFKNFISPEVAISLIFKNMYLDEISSTSSSPRNILDPDFKDIGIAVDTGQLTLGQDVYNVYVATCDFGVPNVSQKDTFRAEFYFMDLVNSARMDLIPTALRLGLDESWVKAQLALRFPEGLPAMNPLVFCDLLSEYALAEADVTLQTMELETMNGTVVRMPIAPMAHYFCATAVNGFSGYIENADDMELLTAVEAIFKEALVTELNDNPLDEPGPMLNPTIRNIGMHFTLTTHSAGEQVRRVWGITVAFSGPLDISNTELEKMATINQARVNPWRTAERLGIHIDPSSVQGESIQLQLPPLVSNHRIYAASAEHAEDMVRYGYYDYSSYDGREDLGDRLRKNGYDHLDFTEHLGLLETFQAFDPVLEGERMVERMLAEDLSFFPRGNHILNPDMTHMGVRLLYTSPAPADVDGESSARSMYFQGKHVLLAVVDLARSAAAKPLAMLGLVYIDKNQNGFYDPDEGLPLNPVTIDDGLMSLRLFTDETGQFSVPIPAGTYHVHSAYADQEQSSWVLLNNEPIMVSLPFQ